MPIETEIKLKVPDLRTAERLLADGQVLSQLHDEFHTTEMHSVYYDTPDDALNRRKWALRLRREGEHSVAALKIDRKTVTPNALFTRDEWQCSGGDIESSLEALVALGAPQELMELGGSLRPMCQIDFERRSAVLALEEGVMVEFCLDNGTIQAQGKQQPLIELEMELLFGAEGVLLDFAAAIQERYGLTREYASKFERALRLLRSR